MASPRPPRLGTRTIAALAVVGVLLGALAALVVAGVGPFGEESDDAGSTAASTTTVPAGLAELDADASEQLLLVGDAEPGDIISLRAADQTTVEWIDRVEGRIISLEVSDTPTSPEVVAEVVVETAGAEWGLIDTAIISDGRRFASWVQAGPGDFGTGNLVVGEIVDGTAVSVVWNAGRVTSTGFGGALDVTDDDRLALALGSGAGWADDRATSGALVTLDPDGGQGQEPTVLADGFVDPRAFVVADDGEIWVWDQADEELERVGRIGGGGLAPFDGPARQPTSIIALPDGRLGVCGRADGVLRAYDTGALAAGRIDGEAIMACTDGAAVLDDGTIVTIAVLDDQVTLQIRRP